MKKGGGVKFQDQQQAQSANQQNAGYNAQNNQDERPKMTYKNPKQCQEFAYDIFAEVDSKFKLFVNNDPKVQRKDTATSIKSLLDSLVEVLDQLNMGTFDDKTKNYYLTYNATIYLFDMCRYLRKSVYSSIAIDYLASAIVSLEGNIVLQTIKYLEWRVKLYIELAHIYEEIGSLQAASKTLERCHKKILKAQELEQKDPPVPDYMQKIFNQNLRVVLSLDLKYKLQHGLIAPDAWKKKIEDYFEQDPMGKVIATFESMRLQNPKTSNTLEKKNLQWKEQAVLIAYEFYKNDAQTISQALNQQFEKMGREVEYNKNSQYWTEEQRMEATMNNRQHDEGMIKDKVWKLASQNFPFEYHIELLHYALEVNNLQVFEEMADYAKTRQKYRRIEIPYIRDLDLKYSENMYPNRNNGYECDYVDLNQASLRMELKNLRNKNKSKSKDNTDAENDQSKKKPDDKNKKKEDPKKKGAVQKQPEPDTSDFHIDGGVGASTEELAQIDHRYVYITIQRSANPKHAIYGVDVSMETQKEKNPQYWEQVSGQVKMKEIPVTQYTGVKETSNKTAWMFLKQTNTDLVKDEEMMRAIVDIKPLFGRSPLVRPDLGYQKIGIDLRQTPQEFIRSPNMEYVYITYKTDHEYFNNERELDILLAFHKLEQSYKKTKIQTLEQEKKVELDLDYDIQLLQELIDTIRTRLEGKLGEQFYNDRKEFLVNLAFLIWNKYIKSQLYQKEFLYELKITNEISEEQFYHYKEHINILNQVFKDGLIVFNIILMQNPDADIIWLCKINLELCKLLEDNEDYSLCVQNLRFCLERIQNYRDQNLARGVESQKDLFLPFSITCNNNKIIQMIEKMKKSYVDQKNQINQEIRIRQLARKQNQEGKKVTKLEQDELQEEEWENIEAANIHLNDDNKDSQYFTGLDKKNQWNETEMIINNLQADILINLFRNQLKDGKSNKKLQYTKNKQLQSQKEQKSEVYMVQSQAKRLMQIPLGENYDGLADKEKIKTTLMQGQTAKTVKKNRDVLQDTLITEGKLEPPKPHIQNYEELLIQETNSNPYQKCLLYMILASNKTKEPDQFTLLEQSYKLILEAEKMEKLHIENGIKDSPFVLSTLLDNKETQRQSSYYFPFDQLYKPRLIPKSKYPRTPILISRTSSQVTFKLPPFYPIIQATGTSALDPNKEKIVSMALYGKISTNQTNVSITNKDLHGTGVRNKLASSITVKNLKQNEKYCFAVGAFDYNEDLSNNEIGKTSEDVLCLHPLSITQLSGYLAKIAYQIGDFQRAELAADHMFSYFTEKSEYLDRNMDYEPNLIYFHRLQQKSISTSSIIEIQTLTESLIVKARCLKRKFFEEQDQNTVTKMKSGTLILNHQKNILTVANYLLMAVETCLCTNNFIQAKKIGTELYNLLGDLLKLKNKTIFVFHLLLKAQMLINAIPEQYWDSNLRILSAKYTYEITKLSFQFNETNLGKRNMYTQTKLFCKKWYTFSKIIMVPEVKEQDLQNKKDDKKAAKKDNKKQSKQPQNQQQEDPEKPKEEVKLIPQLIREVYENPNSVQTYLEQTLLSFPEDYYDYVQRFVETWKERIENFLPFVENSQEDKEQLINELSEQMEFWSSLRDINTAFQKIQAQFKSSPLYLEIICRLSKRLFECNTPANYILQCLESVTELPTSETIKISQDIIQLKRTAIENDIDWFPNILGELIIELQTNKVGNEKAIEIFKDYFIQENKLQNSLKQENYKTPRHQQFVYLNLFYSEFYLLKGINLYLDKNSTTIPQEQNTDIFYDIKQISLQKISEELNQKQKWEDKKNPDLIDNLQQVFEQLANAALHATYAKAWIQLQNILKFVQNLIVYLMYNPFLHSTSTIWKHLTIISQCILELLKQVKQNGLYPLRSQRQEFISQRPEERVSQQQQDQQKVKFQSEDQQQLQEQQQDPQQQQDQQDEQNQEYPKQFPELMNNYTKDVWFPKENFEIDVFANIIGYTIQSLMVEEKWNSLISISRDFCNFTDHYFSNYILPFTIYSQEILYKEAQQKTNDKQEELKKRTQQFEEWKQKNKRKKTRQDILTGVIPQEQLDYERDKETLEKQISLLLEKEHFIKREKDRSQQVIQDINRDSNKALLDLNEARQQYYDIGKDDRIISDDQLLVPEQKEPSNAIKQKKTLIKSQCQNCNKLYKQVIELLTKKQEKYPNAQAKKELGNLNYVLNHYSQQGYQAQIQSSEESWNEVIDLIFSQHSSLKQFRKVLTVYPINTIAHQLGTKNILIAVNTLSNLASISYYKDMHLQREAIQFASQLCFSIFKITLPHPQILLGYGDYRLNQITTQEDLFQDRYAVDETETMVSCEKLSWQLIDADMSLKSLPLLALFDHIATDLNKSLFYSVRAKIMRAIALANCCQINESYNMLQKVFQEKGLPNYWGNNSEYMKFEKGNLWYYQGQQFNNSIHPNEDKNKEITETILTKMDLPNEFAQKYGHLNHNLFIYAKCLLVYKINRNEIFESQELNEARFAFLRQNEQQLRECLQKIAFEEEIEYLKYKSQRYTDLDEIQNEIKQTINHYFSQKGYTQQEIDEYFQNREEKLDYFQKKQERQLNIARIRFLIHQMSASQNLYHRSYYVIKYAIKNLLDYSQEQRLCEKGVEPEVEAIDAIRPSQDDPKSQQQQKGKEKAPPQKKDDKKAGKDPKLVGQTQQQDEVNIEQKIQQQLDQDVELNKKQLEINRMRRHLSAFWLLKLKTELADILFRQNKFRAAQKLLADIIKFDCKTFRDFYFLRLSHELMAKVSIKRGSFNDAIKQFEECINIAKQYHQNDPKYCMMLGDYAEILYERRHFDTACSLFQNALKVSETILNEYNYDLYAQNHYKKSFEEGIKVCQEMLTSQEQEEEILSKSDRLATQIPTKGGKKEEKKGKDDKKKPGDKKQQKGQQQEEQKPEMHIKALNNLDPNYNLQQAGEEKYSYQIIELEKSNNTKQIYNLYLENVVLHIRCVLRWINCVLIKQKLTKQGTPTSFENIIKLLQKVEYMREISKNFLVPISLRLEISYMFAKAYKIKFEESIKEIQDTYINKFLQGKNSKDDTVKELARKYKKLYARKPYRDLARNAYLIEIPNFSQQLKDNLIPLLEESQKHFEAAISLFSRGEHLWFENNRNIEDIFVELTEICLYKREYTPRVGYKYINEDDYQNIIEFKKEINPELKGSEVSVRQHFENLQKTEDNEKLKLENDAFKNMVYAVEVSKIKLDLKQDFHTIATQPVTETSKLPLDLYNDIIESDFLFKKDYKEIIQYPNQPDEEIKLFQEEKKKLNITTIDLIMLIIKYWNDSKILTFTFSQLQNKLSKLHRFLKKYLPAYSTRCIIPHIESLGQIDNGHMVIKNIAQPAQEECKLIYVFGGLDKSKIKCQLSEEEINRIIMNPEQNIIFGNIYISCQDVDKLFQNALDLKTKMQETDQHSPEIIERDYIEYRKTFQKLIEDFGSYFLISDVPSRRQKERSSTNILKNNNNNEENNNNNQDSNAIPEEPEEESIVLQKYLAFVPELNFETLEFFIRIFSEKGMSTMNINQQNQQEETNTKAPPKGAKNQQNQDQNANKDQNPNTSSISINNNLLAIFRYFHSQKYK